MYNDRELLAKTLMAEAGNQGPLGMLAAGSVIMNRVRSGNYGQGLQGVILKPGAFSPWNSVTGFAGGEQGQDMARITPSEQAYRIADALLSGQYEDPTGNATHFYNPDISDPSWGIRGGNEWRRIGEHVFGRADDRAKGPSRVINVGSDAPKLVASDTMAGLGKGGGAVTPDRIAQSAQAQSTGMQDEQRPRGLLGNLFGNPDTMANLALAFNSMRLNPDPNLGAVLTAQMKERRDERNDKAKQNRTVEALKKMGADPRLIELAQAGFGSEALKSALSGTTDKTPAEVRSLQIRAEAAGLVPGTPEYQEFMLYGGGKRDVTPAGFAALDAQARAAGFIPKSEGGDGRYENFMATRGAGLSAQAAAEGKARGQYAGEVSGAEVSARNALELIDLLRNDPALKDMVGPIQGRLPNISSASQRFQSRLDQLQGVAFLEAYQMLKGGGQITEVEGTKAERAIARLNVAQNEEDFLEALKEFEDAVRTGVAKLQAQASGASPQPSVVEPTATAGGGNDPLSIRKR